MKLDDHYVGWNRYFMQCSKLRLNVCHKRETSWPKSFFTAVISFKLVLILGKSIYVYGCLDKKEMAKKLQHGL